jgi:hypothetical protein
MRTVTSAVLTAALGIAACSDALGPSSPLTPSATPPRTTPSLLLSDGRDGFTPADGDRVLFDARTSLQQASTLREALALWGLSQDTRAGWGFTTNFDGAGTHALRVDYTGQATGCTSVSPVLGRTLASPKPKRLYAQWRQWLGRTATGGGLGEIGQFTVNRAGCSATYDRFVWMADRDGASQRTEVKWLGAPETATPAVNVKGISTALRANQGWSFLPQEHAGEVIIQTVYLQAESAPGAADGVVRLWVNGQLFLEHTGLALGDAAFDEFHFPWKSAAPVTGQSEYFWDILLWEPNGGGSEPPPPPPSPAPVASVEVIPATATLEVAQTLQFTATPRDSTGATLTGRTIAWTSSNPLVASVSSSGVVTGLLVGTATITATSENQSGTATVTVVAAPPPPPPPPSGLAIIPGLQGFGTTTPGGRGGAIMRVTNLNATGPGSLQEALAATGPRVVIFEVSGTIRIDGNLVISSPFVTIAGQTAPSPGITLRGGTLRISTHDVVIQHIRLRPGDDPGSRVERDGLEIYGGDEKYNIVIDHVSVSWGVDENVSTGTSSAGVRHDITMSNMIISEGLDDSIHPEGPHSKGVMIGQGTKNVTFMGNLMAHHVDRSPWFKGNTTGIIVNNVIYNWGGSKATYFDDVDNTAAQFASVVGNVYLRGLDSPTNPPIRVYDGVKTGSLFYMADNSLDRAAPPSNPWSLVNNEAGASVIALTPPVWVSGLVARPNANVESWVLGTAGARPADRDAVDLRIVNEVRTLTGRIIDHPSDVGGWPVLAENHRPLTTPANPNGDDDGDGYTNLEEWLHQMAAEVEGRAP